MITEAVSMTIVGVGLGICFPIFNVTIQNAVVHKYLGVATATSQMFRQFGGTIGVALLSIVMNYRFADQSKILFNQSEIVNIWGKEPEAANVLGVIKNPQVLMNPEELAQIESALPQHLKATFFETIELLRTAFIYSLTGVFVLAAILVLAALIAGFFLEEIPLRSSND
jgi:uncharacterized membrane protein YraQ (UPF0718 family)